MVCTRISVMGETDLYVIGNGTLTALGYRNETVCEAKCGCYPSKIYSDGR